MTPPLSCHTWRLTFNLNPECPMKAKTVFVASAIFVATLSGCATPKQLTPTGGSRADGTVKMSFEYGMFEQPQVDGQQGARVAAQRCAAWGYTGAEPFGGAMSQCVATGSAGCVRWRVTYEYQCTGSPKT